MERQDKHRRSERPRFQLARPVFFIGFMGAGKSTVARRLARLCHVSSLDLDTYIERACDKRIRDVFAEEGEEAFRKMETHALREVAELAPPMLVSCGGGVVTTPEARQGLQELGFTVLLDVDVDEAAQRISDTSTRPLFQDVEAARELCRRRRPLYQEASAAVVDTRGKDVFRITCEVRDLLIREEVLCRQ